MAAVSHFVSEFGQACLSSDGERLYKCIALDEESFYILQSTLQSVSVEDICDKALSLTSSTHTKRFTSLLHDVLEYAKSNPFVLNAHSNSCAYDAWVKVYSSMTSCFTLPEAVWLLSALKYVALQLVLLAIRMDNGPPHAKTIDAAGRLSKAAGLAANDRSSMPGSCTKRAAVLKLANLSFRAYFKLRNTRLCETVLGSVNNALLMNRRSDDSDPTGEALYPVSERVTYHFYVGQIRLLQHRIQVAAHHLQWAFDHCTNLQSHNKRKILISLMAAQLILGRYPHPVLLDQFQLRDTFGSMLHYHKLGYAAGVMSELERHREWLRTRGLYMLLREKLVPGLWRNLFQRCMRLNPHVDETSNAPPTLPLVMLVGPARLAWNDDTLLLEDMECMAANLVDQGLMKAYILHSKSMIVLQRGPFRGFPPMLDVYQA